MRNQPRRASVGLVRSASPNSPISHPPSLLDATIHTSSRRKHAQHGHRQHKVLRTLPPKQVLHATSPPCRERLLIEDSLGGSLTDTLDNLITERRIEPQLAMKILLNFDRAVADVLSEKVKSRLTFKVGGACACATLWLSRILTTGTLGAPRYLPLL